jgi:hypothetical protein
MSYVLNFHVEILLILTYDLGSTDQTTNGSRFHMMWVDVLEAKITTCVSRVTYAFVTNLGLLYMTKMSKNGRVSLASISSVNSLVGLGLVRQ